MDILIHRLTWDIVASEQSEATDAQREVSLLMQNPTFLGKLEDRLKGIISNDDFIEVEKLELDLGFLSELEWNKDLEDQVIQKFVDAVAELTQVQSTQSQEKKSMKQHLSNLFFEFIQTGVIPASTPKRINTLNNWGEWMAEAWQEQGLADELKKRIKEDQGLFHSLVLWPLLPLFKPLRQIVGRASSRIKLFGEVDDFLTKLGEEFSAETRTFRKVAWTFLLDDSVAHDISIQAAQDVLMDLSYEVPRGKVKKLQEHMDTLKRTAVNTQYSQVKKKQLDELLKPLPEPKAVPEVDKKLHVNNAGLVLCAPFLPAFLVNCGVGSKKEIQEPEIALAILSYLITGKDKEVMTDLALPKHLCGIPLNKVVVPTSPLPPKLKREAEALLVEMIEHWKALKNTSPNGLREGFLQREGILNETEDGHSLQVETRAQDALLAQLPWSISIIKLPWMNSPLHVDWA
jgi:hypothetical protein